MNPPAQTTCGLPLLRPARRRHLFRLVAGFLLCLCAALPLSAQIDEDLLRRSLAEPVEITDRLGNRFSGHPIAVDASSITLMTRASGGEIERTFTPAQIARLRLPGEDFLPEAIEALRTGQNTEAETLLSALFRQRRPFLPHLEPSERRLYRQLVDLQISQQKPGQAIATARFLHPYAESTRSREELDNAILWGHFKLGPFDEARLLASDWIDQAPRHHHSALGWFVLAELLLREGQPRQALWIAMRPVVFSGSIPMTYLDYAYATAVRCAVAIVEQPPAPGSVPPRPLPGNPEPPELSLARSLLAEMQERKLVWPADLPFPQALNAH